MTEPPISAPSIAGKVYVISGASRGVGLAICRVLHARGARFAMLARNEAELAEHAGEFGEQAFPVRCDVSDKQSVMAAVDAAAAHFGRIDGLVNNAGVATIAPVEQIAFEDMETMFKVNLMGPIYLTQACLPHMRKSGGGNILNISSTSVRHPEEFPYTGGYTSIKSALERLTVDLRAEVSRDNIAVTLFSLGSTISYFGTGWDPEITAKAFAEWSARGGMAPDTMDAALPAEMIVRCLESPPKACADFIQFRPYAERPKGPAMAG
jgi:NAD(P)-dependent dehydrogenase (short-subunit alcohol dehydrogenase family)